MGVNTSVQALELIKRHMKYKPLFTGCRKASAATVECSQVPRKAFSSLVLLLS